MGGIIKDNCKVGYLTTLNSDNDILYKCSCVCGNETYVNKWKLHKRKVTHCGCLESDNVIYDDKNFLGYVERFKKRRVKDGVSFDISVTTDFLWNVYTIKQKKRCALTGLPLSFNGNYRPSIDRIDSSKGYEPNNIQWVYAKINLMKYSFSNKHFVELCKLVANNNEI